jgi:hypothetical protein
MSKEEAEMHIKRQYQKLFQRDGVAEELDKYMGRNRFNEEFNVLSLDQFKSKVRNIQDEDIYGFIKVR